MNEEKIVDLKQLVSKALSEFKRLSNFESVKKLPQHQTELVDYGTNESQRRLPTTGFVELENFHEEIKELKPQVKVNSAKNEQMENFIKRSLMNKLKNIQNNNLRQAF